MGWAKNGESAGTEGAYKRLEAIQIKIVEKGKAAPGSTSNHFVKLTSADLPQLELQFQTHVHTCCSACRGLAENSISNKPARAGHRRKRTVIASAL